MDSRRQKVPSLATFKWVFLEEPRVKQSPKGSFSSKSPQNSSSARLQHLASFSHTSLAQLPKSHRHRETVLAKPASDYIDVETFQKRVPMVQTHQVSSLPDLKFPITARVLAQKASRKPGYCLEASPRPAFKAPKGTYKSPWYLPPERWRQGQDKDSKISALQQTRGKPQVAVQPYFFLHIQEKEGGLSFSQEFTENIKKFQKMPMMSKFKGHLEASNHRVPLFLDHVKSDRTAVESFADW